MVLAPHFVKAFNSFRDTDKIQRDTLLAHISVIPNEGKDPSQCQSYQPISLLNTDLKVFTKIFATQLSRLVPSVVHMDQVELVSGSEAQNNT